MLTEQVPRRHPRGLARGDGTASLTEDMLTERRSAHVRALNEIAQRARPDAGADGDRLDAARPARDVVADRRAAASSSSRTASARCDNLDFSDDELADDRPPRRRVPASTSGRRRATPDGATVAADALERWTRALLEAAGLEPEPAATVAETLVWTSLRGDRLARRRARAGVRRAPARPACSTTAPRPSVVRRDGAIAVVDGDHGPGQVASVARHRPVDRARPRARRRRRRRCGAAATTAPRRSTRCAPPRRAWSAIVDDQHRAARDPVRRRRAGARHEPDRARRADAGRRLQPRHGDQPGGDQPDLQRARRGAADPRGLGRRRATGEPTTDAGRGDVGGAARRLQGLRARR